MHMGSEKMWGELAPYYDYIYEQKNYEQEAAQLHKAIQENKKTSDNKLLDVACGTANHWPYLQEHYTLTGLDLNKEMLKIARTKFPNATFHEEDMTSFELGAEFDVITCLFSSIGYVKTYENLQKTIQCFSNHLKPGGVMIIEPFFTNETYNAGNPHATFVNKPDVKIARMSVPEQEKNVAIMNFHFLLATKDGVKHFTDKHELGLFEVDEFLKILHETGLKTEFRENAIQGKGQYIATKQSTENLKD